MRSGCRSRSESASGDRCTEWPRYSARFPPSPNFAGTLAGSLYDQDKYMNGYGIDVYNPRISGAGLSSYSVEGRATLYEWAYRGYYGRLPNPIPSNYPLITGGAQQLLYNTLYP
jgi:hypothetical protein